VTHNERFHNVFKSFWFIFLQRLHPWWKVTVLTFLQCIRPNVVLSLKILSPVTSRYYHWLKITARIKYKLLSLNYEVLTTTQPPYLHNIISVQRPPSTHSSSLVTVTVVILSKNNNWSLLSLCFTLSPEAIPFTSSSTSLWYQFLHFRLTYSFIHYFFLFWFITLFIHNSLSFTPGLKPTCFTNPNSVVSLLPLGLPSRTITRTIPLQLLGFLFSFPYFFVSVPCAGLGCLVSFWVHVNILYCVVSYRQIKADEPFNYAVYNTNRVKLQFTTISPEFYYLRDSMRRNLPTFRRSCFGTAWIRRRTDGRPCCGRSAWRSAKLGPRGNAVRRAGSPPLRRTWCISRRWNSAEHQMSRRPSNHGTVVDGTIYISNYTVH